MKNREQIRNFSIIAHIDHGKSTLADRLLEQCKAVSVREMEEQLLDNMDLERERGITIKARAVRMEYQADDGRTYEMNLIDTPGHVDFNYEVSRSLAACEGALLVVDAAQGIEAQTLGNTYLAIDAGLEVVPVINKIDLPAADAPRVKKEIEDIIGIPAEDSPEISAKMNINIHEVLERIVSDVPAPVGDPDAPLRALIFDSQYDPYKGVIVYMRLLDGTIRPGMKVKMMATGAEFQVLECGYMLPFGLSPQQELCAGEVGYFTASIKKVSDTRVGDTVTESDRPTPEALPGYRPARPMVFCGIYTEDGSKYPDLRDALEKLQLNDAALSFEPESSVALGFGFRCGFLGMLHMEIIQERLEREFDLDLVTTLPSVTYEIVKTDGTVVQCHNPHDYPDPAVIEEAREPYVKASIMTPQEFVGNIMPMCQDRRGIFKDMQYLDANLVELHYEMPTGEIIYDFFDALKARTKGYASLDYEFLDYRKSDLVKVDMLLNGDQVDALSFIVHRDKSYGRAASAVRGTHSGGHRRQGHRTRDRKGDAQGRSRQVLRRRHQPKEKAARKAEGRQKEDACARYGPDADRGLHGCAQAGRGVMITPRPLGLYLHIPFCVKKCAYCDFYSITDVSRMDAYTSALIRSIREYGEKSAGRTTDTVYLGGGTPSYLGGVRLERILHAVRESFALAEDTEITVECNPESTDAALLDALRRGGANRLSFGVQAAHDNELRRIGRIHDFARARSAVLLAHEHGFSNISLDLMYGLPGQTQDMFLDSLSQCLALEPTHLSCYGLKLEPMTEMGREAPVLPDDDAQADTYLALCRVLSQHGFEHYEISNFALPGFRSRHNSKYWDLSEYIGLGPGAHSLFDGRRFAFPRDIAAFTDGTAAVRNEEEVPDFERQNEYLMLRLRTSDGVELRDLEERYHVDPAPYEAVFRALAKPGLTELNGTRWHLTEAGFLVSNSIINMITDAAT